VKLLVVTPEPVDAAFVRSALGEDVRGAEVLVVSPATNQSRLAFWVSDADEAIEEAKTAATHTAERLDEAGADAVGDTGEAETAQAVDDALATFAADRILLVTHAGKPDPRETAGLADAERRWGVPVSHAEISRGD
jgi:hypothetical protein